MSNQKVTTTDVYNEIKDFREEIRDTYVTKAQFAPIEKIVYSGVALILVTVAGALLAQVVQAAF